MVLPECKRTFMNVLGFSKTVASVGGSTHDVLSFDLLVVVELARGSRRARNRLSPYAFQAPLYRDGRTIGAEQSAVYCPLGKVRTSSRKMPDSCVNRVSSATDCTFNFMVIAVRCSLTVRSWMPRSHAICLLSRPCTT